MVQALAAQLHLQNNISITGLCQPVVYENDVRKGYDLQLFSTVEGVQWGHADHHHIGVDGDARRSHDDGNIVVCNGSVTQSHEYHTAEPTPRCDCVVCTGIYRISLPLARRANPTSFVFFQDAFRDGSGFILEHSKRMTRSSVVVIDEVGIVEADERSGHWPTVRALSQAYDGCIFLVVRLDRVQNVLDLFRNECDDDTIASVIWIDKHDVDAPVLRINKDNENLKVHKFTCQCFASEVIEQVSTVLTDVMSNM